jgi:predicted ATPase
VSDRAPQCVLVVALPGMGKSHLLRELMARFEAQPSPVASVRARAEEVRRETPYATLSELVRRLHAVSPAASASEQASRLEAAIASLLPADRVRRAVAVLSLLLGLRPSGDLHSDVAALDPVRLEEALELTVAEVLRAATARTAVALVIDDAHWADAATLKLVGRASKLLEDAPLFVLLAARPEISEVTPPALRDAITQTLKLARSPSAPRTSWQRGRRLAHVARRDRAHHRAGTRATRCSCSSSSRPAWRTPRARSCRRTCWPRSEGAAAPTRP